MSDASAYQWKDAVRLLQPATVDRWPDRLLPNDRVDV